MTEQEAINTIKASAVREFVETMVGAYESNFVSTPILTIGQLYQVMRNFIKDGYGIETPSLAAQMGKDFAGRCNPKIEARPENCRNRLQDEGKMHPRSGCAHCKNGGITGCPYEK